MSATKLLTRKRSRRAAAGGEEDGADLAPAALTKRAPGRRRKLLALISHGATSKFATLLSDWLSVLPHARKDCKLDQKDRLDAISEMAELAGCDRAIFFEVRKHSDLYLWMGAVPHGPSVKFHVQGVHTMDELSLTGNCLKGSRAVVSYGAGFGEGAAPHLRLVRELLTQTFSVPEGHPRSKPFVDHVHHFDLDPKGRIAYRHYQIAPATGATAAAAAAAAAATGGGAKGGRGAQQQQQQMLVEIGPRCTLTVMRVFGGAFGGQTLYSNAGFVSPNIVRSELRKRVGDAYADKLKQRGARQRRHAAPERQVAEDPVAAVFKE